MEIEITEDEAFMVVGSLKVCSKMGKGGEELGKLADKISKQHLEYLEKEDSE